MTEKSPTKTRSVSCHGIILSNGKGARIVRISTLKAHVIQLCSELYASILERSHIGKGTKVVDKVRLVEVSAIGRQLSPINDHAFLNAIERSAKPPHSTEQLWRQANVFPEQLNKPRMTQSGIGLYLSNTPHSPFTRQLLDRVPDRRVCGSGVCQFSVQVSFQGKELFLVILGAYVVQQAVRFPGVEFAERDIGVVQLMCSYGKEDVTGSRSKRNADDFGGLRWIEFERPRVWAGEQWHLNFQELAIDIEGRSGPIQINHKCHGAVWINALS